MLHNFSEDVVYFLIRRRILDVQKRAVYTYGMEVLLLNGGVLLSTFIISLLGKSLVHYFLFVLVFCSLRMFAGGYHADTAGKCFLLSNGIYVITVVLHKLLQIPQTEFIWLGIGILSIVGIFFAGSMERDTSKVSEKKHKNHEKKLRLLLLFDLILLGGLCVRESEYLNSVAISLFLVVLLQGWKIVKAKKSSQKEQSRERLC
jgi:accessory gene regulator B